MLLVFRDAQHSEQLVHDYLDFDFVLEDDIIWIDSGVEPAGSGDAVLEPLGVAAVFRRLDEVPDQPGDFLSSVILRISF